MFLSPLEAPGTPWRIGQGLSPCLPVLPVYSLALLFIALYLLDLQVSVHFLLCLLLSLHPRYLDHHYLLTLPIFLPGACQLLRPQTERTTDNRKGRGIKGWGKRWKLLIYVFIFETPYPLKALLSTNVPYMFGDYSIKILKFEKKKGIIFITLIINSINSLISLSGTHCPLNFYCTKKAISRTPF